MSMLFLLQQYQEFILTLLKKLFKKNLFIFIGIFTLRASQYCWAGGVDALLRPICGTLVQQHGPMPRICSKLGS